MYGLALQGGGAKGSYHIGVWKALREMGIELTSVVGTSVGALNGAFIAQDDFDVAISLWENITTQKVFNADDKVHDFFENFSFDYTNIDDYVSIFKERNLETYPYVFKKILENGGLDIAPLQNLINELLDEDKIRASKCDFGLVTINLTDIKPMELFIEDIPYGKLTDYLLASSFLPIFKPQKLDGKIFLDGGFYDDLPVEMLVNKGYKHIVTSEIKFHSLVNRLNIMKLEMSDLDLIRIKASDSLGGLLQFNPKIAHENIQRGYEDTLTTFKNRI